jgi:hypothetical protein
MVERIIGREPEKRLLEEVRRSGEPEFLAVYGRRLVGKTPEPRPSSSVTTHGVDALLA